MDLQSLGIDTLLLDMVSDAIYLVGLDGTIHYVNKVACDNRGYSPEELIGQKISKLVTPENLEAQKERVQLIVEKGEGIFVSEHIRRDGTPVPVRIRARIVESGGRKLLLQAVLDISEWKETHDRLLASEKLYRNLIETMHDGLVTTDNDGLITFTNTQMLKMLGYGSHEMLGRSPLTFVDDNFKDRTVKSIQETKQGIKASYEVELIRKDGKRILVRCESCPVYDGGGSIAGRLVTTVDITVQKGYEEALESSREFLDKIMNTIGDPVFVKDHDHKFILVNDAFCSFSGRLRGDLLGADDSLFFPKEQTDVFWKYDELVLESGRESMNEEQLTDAQGAVRTIVTKKTRYVDGSGNRFIVGIIRDITDRKKAEEALRDSVEELRRFREVALDREVRMIQLKQEVNKLAATLQQPAPYDLSFLDKGRHAL